MTEPQFLDGSKTVTRRLGWKTLTVGTQLTAVRQAMGLKKGEKQFVLGVIEVTAVRRERLNKITAEDVRREGFPGHSQGGFIRMFCAANRCTPKSMVTVIEFEHTVMMAEIVGFVNNL